jgi:hypothetical protein
MDLQEIARMLGIKDFPATRKINLTEVIGISKKQTVAEKKKANKRQRLND